MHPALSTFVVGKSVSKMSPLVALRWRAPSPSTMPICSRGGIASPGRRRSSL